MKTGFTIKYIFAAILLQVMACGIHAQQTDTDVIQTTDPRQLSLAIFQDLVRAGTSESLSINIVQAIRLFRYSCTRVTDFQLFTDLQNQKILKVKCAGEPLYGLTVASNGYISVYGGNGILGSLDPRDGEIVSVSLDGRIQEEAISDTRAPFNNEFGRFQFNSNINQGYLAFGMAALMLVMVGSVLVWVRTFRRKADKILQKKQLHFAMTRETKDKLTAESKHISDHIYHHPSGLYLARGKRGHRRVFTGRLWAQLYVSFGIKLFETQHIPEDYHPDLNLGDHKASSSS